MTAGAPPLTRRPMSTGKKVALACLIVFVGLPVAGVFIGGFTKGFKKGFDQSTEDQAAAKARTAREQESVLATSRSKSAEEQVEDAACGPAPEISYGGKQYDLAVWIERRAPQFGDVEVRDCTRPAMGIDSCWVLTCTVRMKNGRSAPIRATFKKNAIGFSPVRDADLERVQADLAARAAR